MSSEQLPRKLAAIFYADVAGYSRLTGADEDATHRTLSAYLDLISESIVAHRGTVMHYAGDAVLAKFDAVVDALRCAAEVQGGLAARNKELPDDRKLQFRIGLNLGDVIEDRGDIYGDGVNVAARLEGLADPGGICISESVRTAVGGRLKLVYEFLGEQRVKNITEPVKAFKVLLDGVAEVKSELTKPESPTLERPSKPSIAVLPFDNLSADPEQEYFADGVTEDIITALSSVQSFFVIARNSTFTYKGKAVDVKRVGRELGVHYVIEGSVRKAGQRVRVTAQLLDAATGQHIWADRYDGALEDIFDLQDQITATVVGAIEPYLNRAEFERIKQKRPDSLDAYDLTLRGLQAMNELIPQSTANALKLFEKAIEADPNYARAYVCASWCHRRHVQLRGMTLSDEAKGACIRLAEAALKLDDTDPYVLWQVAMTRMLVERDFDSGASLIEQSLAINANSTRGWSASGYLRCLTGQPEAAIDSAERAIRLSPLDPSMWVPHGLIAIAKMQLQDYQAAVTFARKSIRLHRYNLPVHHVLVASLAQLDQLDEAGAALMQLLELEPDLTLSRVQQIYPVARYKNLDEFLEGLRNAGLKN
ncbi:MAG: adenylate/guanylate cyclase domain-containing protein [Gammaproteobacteria bacterium]|nr:adenylate/guanylate cyclase domain-containing protein [Gammaproteobacteria bacterium]